MPVYAFHEIWNRTRSRVLLAHFYPRLRQYHMFLAGRVGHSTTRRLASELLQTWDYSYNTGWDDYPPQQYRHQHKPAKTLVPPVTTAHAIRSAKILAGMAERLGEEKDLATYRDDIAAWTGALQRYSWDEESGYYGYVAPRCRGQAGRHSAPRIRRQLQHGHVRHNGSHSPLWNCGATKWRTATAASSTSWSIPAAVQAGTISLRFRLRR